MTDLTSACLLSCGQMGRADAWAMAHGVPGIELMEQAGAAVAAAIAQRWSPRSTVVLCGPGNNGGDGYVVARYLARAGWPVRVAALSPIEALKGDALHHARLWQAMQAESTGVDAGSVLPLSANMQAVDGAALVVDALFGAGLSRALDPAVHDLLEAVHRAGVPLVAVDVPSGLQGDTGQNLGAVPCALTVTFFRKKPAHVLMPGRALCGEVVVADIGIPVQALAPLAGEALPLSQENHPGLWRSHWGPPGLAGHKYQRGHALVFGGARMLGAARLCARGAARVGAGLVTLLVPRSVWPVYAATLLSAMAQPVDDEQPATMLASWAQQLEDLRWHALAMGPGARLALPGASSDTLRSLVLAVLSEPLARPVVLDADALTVFEELPSQLFEALHERLRPAVLTPHEGEFTRLFGPGPQGEGSDKISRTRAAAALSGAVVLHKGADTVVAAPDGRVVVNTKGSAWLATGGSGDVLTGLIVGLLAQGVPAMEAACAAAWLHGACAQAFGPGLLAEDLPEQLPAVLSALWGQG